MKNEWEKIDSFLEVLKLLLCMSLGIHSEYWMKLVFTHSPKGLFWQFTPRTLATTTSTIYNVQHSTYMLIFTKEEKLEKQEKNLHGTRDNDISNNLNSQLLSWELKVRLHWSTYISSFLKVWLQDWSTYISSFCRSIRISIMAYWIKSLHLKDDPECYEFNVTVSQFASLNLRFN